MRWEDDWEMGESRLKRAESATLKSSAAIVFLSVLKGIVGFWFGSLVLLTDALHSFTDLVANTASLIGLRIAQRKPDEKFAFGYFKAENLSALFISLFILYGVYELFLNGLNALSETPSLTNPLFPAAAAMISIITSYLLSKYLISRGEDTGSQSLVANGKEKKVDVITSSIVLVAIILSYYQVPYVEGLVTIGLSLLIFREGLESAKNSIFSLMDVSPSKEVERKVLQALSEVSGVEGYKNLRLRRSGPFILGELEAIVRKQVKVNEARRICDRIEEKAKQKVGEIKSLTISVQPYEPEERLVVLPVQDDDKTIMQHFGRAEQFLLAKVRGGEVVSERTINNKFKNENVRAGLKAARFLVDEGVDAIVLKEVGEISFHVLRDHLVQVYLTREKDSGKSLEKLLSGELEELGEPTKKGFEKARG